MINELTIFYDLYVARADVLMAVSALALLVVGVFLKQNALQRIAIAAVTVLFVTLVMTLQQDNNDAPITLFNDMIVYDRYGVFMKTLILIGAMAAVVMIVRDTAGHVFGRFESIILVMLATLGMSIMVSANNMLSLYVGLELQSLSLYILASMNRNSLVSAEAGLKYFILGALSSGLLLFGISLVYGFTGTTSFPLIADIILMGQDATIPMPLIIGLVFVLVGLAFKISAVPFHMWTPDVYQGSPSSVTAFFAMAPKIAAVALIGRLLFSPFGELQSEWVQIIYVLSMASMIVGAFAGLVQKNLYRLLAYSSIGNMGFILLGFIAGGLEGMTATLVYLAIYLIATAGLFAMILSVRDKNNVAAVNLSDFAGLSKKSPVVSYGLAIMLFSMAGIPPLAGFFAKLFVFKAVILNGHIVLAVVGMMASVVAAYYYLKLIKIMFFDQPSASADYNVQSSGLLRWVALPSVAFITLYIIAPDRLVYEATQAALSLN
jgi:NADH-quinone oxidoreductase subunit N